MDGRRHDDRGEAAPARVVLGRRYRLERPIGRGGMGTVVHATDLVLERPVAVKLLTPHLATDHRAVERFRREARAAAGLSHPDVVAVYDSGSDGDRHWIVMEEVRGRTLAQILRAGPLPPRDAVRVARHIASALAAAHARGIVHRDVTTGNVMLTDDGRIKVMDFGIAQAASTPSLTGTSTVLGTATYLAPEQARGEPASPATDLYALGVVLYELLTGRPPFTGESPVAVAYQHVRADPARPSTLDPSIPPALDDLVLRLLAKDPAGRPRSAAALVEELARLGTDRHGDAAATLSLPPATTTPLPVTDAAGPDPAAAPGPRRGRWAAAAAFAAAFLVVGLVSGLLYLGLTGPGAGAGSPGTTPSVRPTAVSSVPSQPSASPTAGHGPKKPKKHHGHGT